MKYEKNYRLHKKNKYDKLCKYNFNLVNIQPELVIRCANITFDGLFLNGYVVRKTLRGFEYTTIHIMVVDEYSNRKELYDLFDSVDLISFENEVLEVKYYLERNKVISNSNLVDLIIIKARTNYMYYIDEIDLIV